MQSELTSEKQNARLRKVRSSNSETFSTRLRKIKWNLRKRQHKLGTCLGQESETTGWGRNPLASSGNYGPRHPDTAAVAGFEARARVSGHGVVGFDQGVTFRPRQAAAHSRSPPCTAGPRLAGPDATGRMGRMHQACARPPGNNNNTIMTNSRQQTTKHTQ